MRVRVEHIIVIADHRVHPGGHIQAHFIGTYLPGLTLGQQRFPVKSILPVQQLEYRLIDPVKMPSGPWTGGGIAVCFVTDAHLLLRSQNQNLAGQPLLAENLKGLPGHFPGDGLGSQVKHLLRDPLPHGTHGWKHCGHGLSQACGGLEKQLLFPQDGPVDAAYHFPLPFPVGKWEFQPLHGRIPLLFPLVLPVGPAVIGIQQPVKPFSQFFHGVGKGKTPDFLRIQIAVGHLHPHLFLILLSSPDQRVTLRLGQMYRRRLRQRCHIPVDSFDLIDGKALIPGDNPIRPSLQPDGKIIVFLLIGQRHLRLVSPAHLPLNLPVDPAALGHSLPVSQSASSIVQIPRPENKFHQISHGNPNHLMLHRCPSFPISLLRLLYHKKRAKPCPPCSSGLVPTSAYTAFPPKRGNCF